MDPRPKRSHRWYRKRTFFAAGATYEASLATAAALGSLDLASFGADVAKFLAALVSTLAPGNEACKKVKDEYGTQ